ncbi:MAG: hypothetical protein IT258_15150 [Saprospiraceae bacterium]|nr:hypothetical protein [Saprospiraceae bacterium]
MESILTSILGPLLGFVFGFLAEPIKFFTSNFIKRKQFRNGLYREIINLYSKIQNETNSFNLEGHYLLDYRRNLENNCTEFYKFAKTEPLLYYGLKEATMIDAFYNNYFFLLKIIPTEEELRMEEKTISDIKSQVLSTKDESVLDNLKRVLDSAYNGRMEQKLIAKRGGELIIKGFKETVMKNDLIKNCMTKISKEIKSDFIEKVLK